MRKGRNVWYVSAGGFIVKHKPSPKFTAKIFTMFATVLTLCVSTVPFDGTPLTILTLSKSVSFPDCCLIHYR